MDAVVFVSISTFFTLTLLFIFQFNVCELIQPHFLS